MILSQDGRYYEIFYSYYYTRSSLKLRIFQKINHQINVSKKKNDHIQYTKILEKKKSTTTFDETSLGEIKCEMQQNGKIDDKFKIINPVH